MRRSLLALSLVIAAVLPSRAPAQPAAFEVQRLADGVYATVRREPPSLYFEPNALFIIGDRDVIVVDAQFSLASTRDVLAALRRLTSKPVRYVINTHGHDDHITGNQVYRDAFPGVEFIAHRGVRDDLRTKAKGRRESFVKTLPGTLAFFGGLLRDGKGPDGAPLSDEERRGFRSDSTLGARFLAEAPELELVAATRVVDDRLVLRQGRRRVEVLHLGRGHSPGDVVVHLPDEGIVASGDLLVHPVPLVGSTSHPVEYAAALERLRALRPRIIVPGHGGVMRDTVHLGRMVQLLRDVSDEVAAAAARGDSLGAVRRSAALARFRDTFAGDSRLQRFAFSNYVTASSVTAAWNDLQGSRAALATGTLAITHVTLIPMSRDTVLRDATVIVRDGRIAAVGPASGLDVPAGARRIDGRGKYLIPGLADMHAHLFADGDAPDSVAPYELGAMLANGITATRLMMGTAEQLALRSAVRRGAVGGPQLWLASPEFAGRAYGDAFAGTAIPTPDAARAAVRAAADAGYDFIKVTLFVPRETFNALADEAKQRSIRVVGHVDPAVGVEHAMAAGQHVEHLDNYLESILADSAPMKASVSDRGVYRPQNWESLDHVDAAKLARLAGVTARSGTFTTPTLTIFRHAFAQRVPNDSLQRWPDWHMYPAAARELWLGSQARYWASAAAEPRRARWTTTRYALVKAIADSGGRIMAGSDAPEFLHSHGWTLHRELQSLVAAGLTPYQALAAATRTPAEFLGASEHWGTIEAGKRADLVLLDANPLDDIRHTTTIAGVSFGGRWIQATELRALVRDAMNRLSGSVAPAYAR